MTESLITKHLDLWTSAIEAKSTAGRGSSNKFDLYGIKKLRELILELAVRGKLVPQDPMDEPASVLLSQIAAEKNRLIKEQKFKKNDELQQITNGELPFELPQGWEWARLGYLSSDIHYGYTASAKDSFTGVRLLRITDIQNDKVNWDTVPDCDIEESKISNYLLENDDILIARTGGTIGKSYLVESIDVRSVFASYLIRVKRIDCMYSPFIKTYLGSQLYWRQLFDNAAGTGQPNVNATALKSLLVTLPPLREQYRIVAKVNELMALCDQLEQQTLTSMEAHTTLVETLLATLTASANADELAQNWSRISEHFDTLFTTEQSIDLLKQTILQLAVMGKLVPQDPTDEPATVLLEKIAAEKAQLIKDKKIKKEKPLPPISDEEKPFELPQGWEWCRLGELGICSTGKTPSTNITSFYSGDLPFIGPGQISPQGEIYSVEKFLSDTGMQNSSVVNKNDILMVCIGGTIGKSAYVPYTLAFNQQINAISPLIVESIYLLYALNSDYFQCLVVSNSSGSATPIINRSKWELLPVPLPPIKEQKNIIDKVNLLMNLFTQIIHGISNTEVISSRLTDTLFRQEL